MILRPSEIYPDNITFDADDTITINWKNKGDIMYAYEIFVENNSIGGLVYTSGKVFSFEARHFIPASMLSNGNTYNYRIMVYNKDNQSALSEIKVFKCASKPIVTILTDGIVRNQTLTAFASYTQSEDIPVKCYRFVLYDEYGNVIEQSKYIYDNELVYTFNTLLKDDTKYQIQCFVISQNDLLGQSGIIEFVADYIPPSVHFNLKTEVPTDKPYVRLSWTTVRIIGKTKYKPVYIDNKELDLINNTLYFDEGFSMDKDFTVKFWIRNIKHDVTLVKLIGENGEIIVKFYNNRFHAFKSISGYVTHISTNEISSLTADSRFSVSLQQIGNLLNINCEVS